MPTTRWSSSTSRRDWSSTVRESDGTLVNGLLARFPDIAGVGAADRPGIVHRLDAGSSGLLVVARAAAANSLISQVRRPRPADGMPPWHGATRRNVESSTPRSAAILLIR